MGKQTYQCEHCGKTYTTYYNAQRKFCSRACGKAATQASHTCTCEQCGASFTASTASIGRYCSQACYWQSLKGKKPSNYDPVTVICQTCGKPFTDIRARQGIAKYCSYACAGKARRKKHERACLQCGKTFLVWSPRKDTARFCSHQCQGRYYSGDNSYAWKGGVRKHYYGPNWHEQKRAARERDDHRCQVCGRNRRVLKYEPHVHHITPFRLFNGDYRQANALTNLICLCRACHRLAETDKIAFQPWLI